VGEIRLKELQGLRRPSLTGGLSTNRTAPRAEKVGLQVVGVRLEQLIGLRRPFLTGGLSTTRTPLAYRLVKYD
jgi:hypothetical protein